MEGKRMAGSSSSSSLSSSPSSSLVSELFGRKDSSGKSSSSSGIFGSLFPSTSPVMGRRESSHHSYHNSNAKTTAVAASESKPSEGRRNSFRSDVGNSTIHAAGKTDPCYLSSSVYYGGQDFCSHPNWSSDSSASPCDKHYLYKKDGERDSDPIDSRGDWWQGSLYY